MEKSDDQRTIADGPPSHMDDLRDDGSGLIGVDVGGYVIDGELGRGGMGVVFSATHPVIGKRAAIKVLKPSLSNNPATVERFVQEARSVNQIGHPNIVDIFAFGKLPDGRSYLVMDMLEGESLRKRVKRGPLTIGEAIHVIDEIASALAAAHDKGFIHRDLKPDNVFLVVHEGRTQCKLLDFGLAKLMSSAMPARAFRTATGAQIGTPDYMSPEQLRGAGGVDARTDIYALGVLAFEILVGGRPRRFSDGSFELQGQTIGEAIVAKAAPPSELVQLVESMLAVDPERRPSLAAIRAVLKRVRTAVPSTSVIGLEVSLPPVRAIGTEPVVDPSAVGTRPPVQIPQSGAQTLPRMRREAEAAVSQSPVSHPSAQSAQVNAGAGLRAGAAGSTRLGVAPFGARPSRPNPVPSSERLPATQPRSESRVWLIVGIVLVVASALGLAFVLAR